MDSTGLVWKRVLKITLFGLKSGQDFKNRAAHLHQEFAGVPPGDTSLFSQGVKSFTYLRTKTGTHQYDRLLTKDIHPKCLSFSRANYHWRVQNFFSVCRGGSRGRVQGERTPPSPRNDLRFSNTTGILQKKKKPMWFVGVEVEQETSAPPPKKSWIRPRFVSKGLVSKRPDSFRVFQIS